MQLGVFTSGAYIWPVHRSFEAFIASLGTPVNDARVLADNPQYPARQHTDNMLHEMEPRLDDRLRMLHKDLYAGLLRPREYFDRDPRTIGEVFWPDLAGTPVEELLNGFVFYFVNQTINEVHVTKGLSVFRAVFFNHESAEPDLWLSKSVDRLAQERADWPVIKTVFTAPEHARLNDLSFIIHSGRGRAATGPGWIRGRAKRRASGELLVETECGRDPSLGTPAEVEQALPVIQAEVQTQISHVFGWKQVVVA